MSALPQLGPARAPQGDQREARDREREILLGRRAIEPSIGEPGTRRFFARA
jgi:hypothetical protein